MGTMDTDIDKIPESMWNAAEYRITLGKIPAKNVTVIIKG
tara:strand:+ start:504 stop:623 length:120 start_codon:yes stop_codon:yes gene_type:complete